MCQVILVAATPASQVTLRFLGLPTGPWNWLEIAKLLVAACIPVAVGILGIYFNRLAKRFEHLQWRNQRLIEKRIATYDALAPHFNDLLCYFTFVGCWKDFTPPQVIARKREIDKQIYLAAPLFSDEFYTATNDFMNLCYATFQGWGRDARLRTLPDRRRGAGAGEWSQSWDACFSDEVTQPQEIQDAYLRIMTVFANDIGLQPEGTAKKGRLGRYPSNIRSASEHA